MFKMWFGGGGGTKKDSPKKGGPRVTSINLEGGRGFSNLEAKVYQQPLSLQ